MSTGKDVAVGYLDRSKAAQFKPFASESLTP
jgi:hypothetical protein